MDLVHSACSCTAVNIVIVLFWFRFFHWYDSSMSAVSAIYRWYNLWRILPCYGTLLGLVPICIDLYRCIGHSFSSLLILSHHLVPSCWSASRILQVSFKAEIFGPKPHLLSFQLVYNPWVFDWEWKFQYIMKTFQIFA